MTVVVAVKVIKVQNASLKSEEVMCKGDKPRPILDRDTYNENFDRIFRKGSEVIKDELDVVFGASVANDMPISSLS